MNETTWAVSRGEYSDYRVEAVFATKEIAERFVEEMGHEGYGELQVEDFPFYREVPPITRVYRYSASISKQGQVEQREPRWFGVLTSADYKEAAPRVYWRGDGYITLPVVDIVVEGTNQERVAKTFSERLAQAIEEFKLGRRQA